MHKPQRYTRLRAYEFQIDYAVFKYEKKQTNSRREQMQVTYTSTIYARIERAIANDKMRWNAIDRWMDGWIDDKLVVRTKTSVTGYK